MSYVMLSSGSDFVRDEQDMPPKRHQKRATATPTKQPTRSYVKHVSKALPESPIFGCGNTQHFDEFHLAQNDDISQINVRSGDLIDGIRVKYRQGGQGSLHGGKGGNLQTLRLRPGEKIIAVRGTLQLCAGNRQIASLTFETDRGQAKTFGNSSGGEAFTFEMKDGAYLAAIKGYDLYEGNSETFPGWDGDFRLLPALGFIAKY